VAWPLQSGETEVNLARPIAVACSIVLLQACGGEGEAHDDPADGQGAAAAIIGGRAESGYPAAGYLALEIAGEVKVPICTVVLLRPDVAVTARHCVKNEGRYAVGFGSVGSSPLLTARVVPNPDADVAALVLEQDVAPSIAKPTVIGRAAVGATARAVGYGRTVEGDRESTRGSGGERKSYEERVGYVDERVVAAEGLDGGTCYGDSGGPLFVGNVVVGLSSVIERPYLGKPCREGNKVNYSALARSCAFLDATVTDRPRSGFRSFCP
jgi:hypothetical protein